MSEEKEYFGAFPWWLRLTVLPWYIWAFLAVTAVWATSAVADDVLIAKFGQLTVTLYQKPCTNKAVLEQLEARVHPTYKAGEADHAKLGHRHLCYLSLPKYETVFVIDEQGGQADLPKAAFRPFGTGV